jgi:sugar phosphate isomerase/epimerase
MLELEGASYVGRIDEAARLLNAVDSPSIALCWDVCNGWWSGEDPWNEAMPIARDLPIVDVQTKDVRASEDDPSKPAFEQVILGEGDIRYQDIVSALIASGYDGWFTAERVYHPRKPEVEARLRADIVSDIVNLQRLVSAA